jgi:NADH-quinone oxidoreductase subunit J
VDGSTIALGRTLFTRFALPFEIISLVLLVAMIGTVLLSKRDVK